MIVGAVVLAGVTHWACARAGATWRSRARRRRRRCRGSRSGSPRSPSPRSPRPGWCPTLASLAGGMDRADTMWYHMPLATRFAHGAHFGAIDYFDPIFFASYYPANSEVVHAVPLLAFDRDILSPLINLGLARARAHRLVRDRAPVRARAAEPDRRRDRARRADAGRVPGGGGAERHRRRGADPCCGCRAGECSRCRALGAGGGVARSTVLALLRMSPGRPRPRRSSAGASPAGVGWGMGMRPLWPLPGWQRGWRPGRSCRSWRR